MNKKICLVLMGLLILSVSAQSLAATARTRSGSYNTVAGEVDDEDPSLEGEFSNSVTFKPRRGERFISVRIEDKSGLPTRALVVQSKKGATGADYVMEEEICGRTKAPLRINSSLDVSVVIQDGLCSDGTTGAATFGTVTAVFK